MIALILKGVAKRRSRVQVTGIYVIDIHGGYAELHPAYQI